MPGLQSAIGVVAVAIALLAGGADPAPDPSGLFNRTGSAIEHETPHLSLRASLSREEVPPGGRITVAVDVTPKPGMHVYAPGSHYRAFALVLEKHPLLHVGDAVYPEPALYLFEPLNEAVLVYSKPFRLARAVTAGRTPEERAKLRKQKTLTLAGTIEYQACDDRVCYLPASIPVSWSVRIQP